MAAYYEQPPPLVEQQTLLAYSPSQGAAFYYSRTYLDGTVVYSSEVSRGSVVTVDRDVLSGNTVTGNTVSGTIYSGSVQLPDPNLPLGQQGQGQIGKPPGKGFNINKPGGKGGFPGR